MWRNIQNYALKTFSAVKKSFENMIISSRGLYPSFLPSNINGISSWFLRRFYSGIVISNDQLNSIKKIPPNAIIVYLTKKKSQFEFLFYHTRYQEFHLPVPELGMGYKFFLFQTFSRTIRMGIGALDSIFCKRRLPNGFRDNYVREELIGGKIGLMSLVEKKGFNRRFIKSKTDPIQYLVELQRSIDRPIFIVPQLIFFSTKPNPAIMSLTDSIFGTEQSPGKWRRLAILFKKPGKVFVEISEPLNLRQCIESVEYDGKSTQYISLQLRRLILTRINRHRQSITGPIIKSHEEMKESILTSDRLEKFMTEYSLSRKESIYKVRKEAENYLDEIAAKYHVGVIRFMSVLVGWLTNTMFDGADVNYDGLQKVKQMSQKGPLVLLPCHKSHIDYLILSYILYKNNMPCPHIAAGKNLSFWPLGPIFRTGGAFFIRRTFKGAILYSRVISEYIHKLLEEGFNIEQFLEGGRSRTGKLLMPKLGLLSILLNAYKNNACEDMIFVPVFIGYDRIIEEKAYLHELEGGKKEPENLVQVIKARKFLKKRYGKIYIKFNDPISLNELLNKYETDLNDMASNEQNALCRDLGWRVVNAIDNVTVVTPHSLVACVVLNLSLNNFSNAQIRQKAETYLKYLYTQKAQLADTLLLNHQKAIQNAFDIFIQRKFIEKNPANDNDQTERILFKINTGKRPVLEYYKNNCIAYFIPPAFTAMAILEKDAFQFSATDLHDRYVFLRNFFKYEFAFNVDRPPEYYVRKCLKSFIDDAILMPHRTLPDTYKITSAGLRKLILFSRFLKTYFESYKVVLSYIKKDSKDNERKKDKIKKIQSIGNKMYKSKEIGLIESLSKINYNNAVNFFTTNDIRNSKNRGAIHYYESVINKYLRILS